MPNNIKMPLQPIIDGRFVPNRIVELLLETSTLNLNNIAFMDFTNQERMQLAQLIGYSLSGFGDLNYVDDETYETAEVLNDKLVQSEKDANLLVLRRELVEIKKGLKIAAIAAFGIHPDELDN